ncbi:hypothetical protein [Brevundimonas diminuta]|uniref:hypothetical protein n=1 Tax=Brevundimonas diminuta TaxID=293 RepID=UPI003D9A9C77
MNDDMHNDHEHHMERREYYRPAWSLILDTIRSRGAACSLLVGAMTVGACTAEPEASVADTSSRSVALATPAVEMEADPPPAFTYWAPEGSTIRNHPQDPNIWIAEGTDGSRTYYFGDQCRASERQDWVGQPVETLPKPPVDAVWRIGTTTSPQTSDLRRERLNISVDEKTRRVARVACG